MIQIKHRCTGSVLFECDEPEGVESGLWMRHAVEKATYARANLADANLTGAKIGDKMLIETRPVMQIGPIGSRSDYLLSYLTNAGVMVKAGCFFGTLDEFAAAVEKTHGDNEHGKEYRMAILMIESHAALWGKQ